MNSDKSTAAFTVLTTTSVASFLANYNALMTAILVTISVILGIRKLYRTLNKKDANGSNSEETPRSPRS